MCKGGGRLVSGVGKFLGISGGGSGANDSARAAHDAEQARQQRIRQSIDSVNRIFDNPSRQSMYDNHRNAFFDYHKNKIDRQAEDMFRQNRFGLARSGLSGGSVDAESNSEINRNINDAILGARGGANAAANSLRGMDERARANLISMASNGMDSQNAANQALNHLKQNSDSSFNELSVARQNNFLAGLGNAYMQNQANAPYTDPNAQIGFGLQAKNPRSSYQGYIQNY